MVAAVGLLLTAGAVHVTPQGGIGPLSIDHSTRAAVVAFAGRPQVERHGYAPNQGAPKYDALGYGCKRVRDRGWPLGKRGTYCLTVFWINTRVGKLGDFYTQDPRYVAPYGIHVGTSSAVAESRLHQRLLSGCEENLDVGSLAIAFAGGKIGGTPTNHVTGAHVYALALEGNDSVGVFDCL